MTISCACNELLFRGYLQNTAIASLNTVKGIVLVAVLSSAYHLSTKFAYSFYPTCAELFALFVNSLMVALFLGFIAYRTRNVMATTTIQIFML